jgi:8-oxo-dGTP pyrophosphatase MutT (NUDIX family)
MKTSPEEATVFAATRKESAHVAGVRPRDAASILLIDRSSNTPKVLMGRRGRGHVFMPDLYVFPGGRRDPRDHALPYRRDLHPLVIEKLMAGSRSGMGVKGARALALAAIRELCEETGAAIIDAPAADLSTLRYVARAITPPGNVRRFDTRFFLGFCDEMSLDLSNLGASSELVDLRWLDMTDLSSLNMPLITRTVLSEVKELMAANPSPSFGSPVPFYSARHGQLVRTRL